MYMIDLKKIIEFEWDEGNLDKSYEKHGITPKEAEEVFLDENLSIQRDIRHQEIEERSIAIGATAEGTILFIVFTFRKNKVRVISARRANKKERKLYETAEKNTKI